MIERYGPLASYAISLFINYWYPQSTGKGWDSNSESQTTPAKWTFGIWSLIYLLIAYIVVLQAAGQTQLNQTEVLLFIILCVLNTSWIMGWFNDQTLICIFILIGMAVTSFKLWVNTSNKIVKVTFAIYFAWVLSALILNKNEFLKNNLGVKSDNILLLGVITPLLVFHAFYLLAVYQNWCPLSIVIPLVGLWTAAGIYGKDKKKGLIAVSGMLVLVAIALQMNK